MTELGLSGFFQDLRYAMRQLRMQDCGGWTLPTASAEPIAFGTLENPRSGQVWKNFRVAPVIHRESKIEHVPNDKICPAEWENRKAI